MELHEDISGQTPAGVRTPTCVGSSKGLRAAALSMRQVLCSISNTHTHFYRSEY
ncbi:hypothetical protein E2C01_004541 [Portunus trituberculatus]|uniref:Uncharacterized protein n=1 Tax=Portunus trituberculatus TaxID=210409 RepID=A0A5B7CU94_PORTR|nr:hypothetical protein [Portunus trituberculatus]